jgi:hypothetical protein
VVGDVPGDRQQKQPGELSQEGDETAPGGIPAQGQDL